MYNEYNNLLKKIILDYQLKKVLITTSFFFQLGCRNKLLLRYYYKIFVFIFYWSVNIKLIH